MSSSKGFMAAGMVRSRLYLYNRIRGGEGGGESRWVTQGHQERPEGYRFNRTPLQPGMSFEMSFIPFYFGLLSLFILGFASTIDKKAPERPEKQNLAAASDDSERSD